MAARKEDWVKVKCWSTKVIIEFEGNIAGGCRQLMHFVSTEKKRDLLALLEKDVMAAEATAAQREEADHA